METPTQISFIDLIANIPTEQLRTLSEAFRKEVERREAEENGVISV